MKHNSQNQQAYNSLKTGTKLLSVLLDPDKCLPIHLPEVFWPHLQLEHPRKTTPDQFSSYRF